jgi:hypothetical protein
MISCKKNKEQDYRDPFTGNYSFFVRTYITTTEDSTYLDTTWNYNGSITKGENSDDIHIQYFPSLKIYAILSEKGLVSNFPILDGSFDGTNKIKFVVRWLGTFCKSSDSVTGTRK